MPCPYTAAARSAVAQASGIVTYPRLGLAGWVTFCLWMRQSPRRWVTQTQSWASAHRRSSSSAPPPFVQGVATAHPAVPRRKKGGTSKANPHSWAVVADRCCCIRLVGHSPSQLRNGIWYAHWLGHWLPYGCSRGGTTGSLRGWMSAKSRKQRFPLSKGSRCFYFTLYK